ncbi:DUF4931 domain-containing protein [Romboutsia maritimum]|uniref:DUF4931 domain-containing protein n=1 Tax=Romboutsia maritimum TaxID=2020948 RepID=A0A371IW66_9FIRM|nr:DUF4931 domain-containing protein [Romboutsia maritimum]RDY24723.1 DUF4931 domain-containing protein [Romboutsia maritimum]
MKEIRIDSVNNDMIVFAKDRSKRPIDVVITQTEKEVSKEYEKKCPFCRGNEELSTKETFKIQEKNDWVVKSIYNKFPILDGVGKEIYGIHEVMIDTYRHNGNFYNMTEEEFKNLFVMYKNRYKNLINDNNVEYVSIFKNFLRKSGASLEHPHSQIISLSIIPPDIENEIAISKKYYMDKHKSLYDDIIKDEIQHKKRVIYNGKRFLVIVPYASKYSGEVRILFKEKIKFENIKDEDIYELSYIFMKLFKNLYRDKGYTPFNLCIHTHPKNIEQENYFNVHMHIIPRKYSFGGFELGTGVYVSSTNPEELAKKLKFK